MGKEKLRGSLPPRAGLLSNRRPAGRAASRQYGKTPPATRVDGGVCRAGLERLDVLDDRGKALDAVRPRGQDFETLVGHRHHVFPLGRE